MFYDKIEDLRNNFDLERIPKSMRGLVEHAFELSLKKKKTKDEYTDLYEIVDALAVKAKNMTKSYSAAMFAEILVYLFFPKILTSCGVVYYYKLEFLNDRLEFDDIFQEAVIDFLEFIKKYEKGKSTFSYYIGKFFDKHITELLRSDINYIKMTPVSMSVNSQARDNIYSDADSLLNELAEKEVMEAILQILKKVRKKGRTRTVDRVCESFLNGKTCSELAENLGLSYHAIYEIKQRIQIQIADEVNFNRFSSYFITLSKDKFRTFKIEERTKKIDTEINIRRCTNCKSIIGSIVPKKENRIMGSMNCKYCGIKIYFRSKVA